MANSRSIAMLLLVIVLSLVVLISSSGTSRIGLLHSGQDVPRQAEGQAASDRGGFSVRLQALVYGSLEESEWMLREAQEFMDSHPNVRIELTAWPDAVDFETVVRHIRHERRADVYLMDNLWVLGAAAMGLLEPVSAAGEALDPALRQQLEWNGFAWAVPLYIEPYVVVWHRSAEPIADENGLVQFARLRQALGARMGRWLEERLPGQGEVVTGEADQAGPVPEDGSREEVREENLSEDPPDSRPETIPESGRPDIRPEGAPGGREPAEWTVWFDLNDPVSAVYMLREEDAFTALIMEQAAALAPPRQEGPYPAPPRTVWEMVKEGNIAALIVPVTQYARQRDGTLSASPLLDDRPIGRGGQMWSRGKSLAIRAGSPQAEAARQWVEWLASGGRPNALPGLPPQLAESSAYPWTIWLNADLRAVRDWLPSAKFLTGSPEFPVLLEAYRRAANSYIPGTDTWRPLVSEVSRIANPASPVSF